MLSNNINNVKNKYNFFEPMVQKKVFKRERRLVKISTYQGLHIIFLNYY